MTQVLASSRRQKRKLSNQKLWQQLLWQLFTLADILLRKGLLYKPLNPSLIC